MVEGVVCGAVGWVLGVVAGVLGGVVGVLRGWVLGAAEGAVGGVVRGAVGVGAGSRGGGGWWGGVAFRGGGCWGLCWARWRVWCEAPWGWVLGAVAGQIKLVHAATEVCSQCPIWFSEWGGVKKVTRHYLKQWWPSSQTHLWVTRSLNQRNIT